MSEEICSICTSDFDPEKEGGISGFIGILPVHFCPTCTSGIFDMVEQMCEHCIEREAATD